MSNNSENVTYQYPQPIYPLECISIQTGYKLLLLILIYLSHKLLHKLEVQYGYHLPEFFAIVPVYIAQLMIDVNGANNNARIIKIWDHSF